METKIINEIEHIKFKVSSQLVTADLSGYVWATCEDEAIEKFQSGEVIGEIDEEPNREEVNIEVEFDIN
jgi:hypothetical protein